MSKFIAILQGTRYSCEWEDEFIPHGITDWSEVSDEDFDLLKKAEWKSQHYNSKISPFIIIERPINEPKFIAKSIEDYKKEILAEKKKELERKQAAEQKKQANKAKQVEKLKAKLAVLEESADLK